MPIDMMTSQVTATFERRAALVDSTASDRIVAQALEACPRSRRRFALAGSAASAAGIGGAVAAVLTLTSATPAFASWTASPAQATASQRVKATQVCASQIAALPGGPGQTTWTPTVTDVRGAYVLEELTSGSTTATCLAGPSLVSVSVGRGGSISGSSAGSGDPGGTSSTSNYADGEPIQQLSLSSLNTKGGAPFDTLQGSVAADVTAVSITLADGQQLQATVDGGLLLAWWPNGSKPVSAQVTTTSGTTTQSLGTFGPGPGAIVHGAKVPGGQVGRGHFQLRSSSARSGAGSSTSRSRSGRS